MLVLGRRIGEWIQVGDSRVVVLHASANRVSLGVEADSRIKILRGEIIERENDGERPVE